jgi:type II secretory pathway component GspD/PulD (secretin)
VGITLDVTPHIGSDGTIRMELAPSISSVGTSSTPISEFASAPFINNREADTTVTCYDGQTVIIGGFITTRDEVREDKVPLLGDIPLLGLLFRNTVKEKRARELLIFLTPTVMRTPSGVKSTLSRQVINNDTLTGVKRDHPFKDRLLNTIRGDDMQKAIREPSPILPDNPAELRRNTLRRMLHELEIIPHLDDEPKAILPDGREIEDEVD